ncbi:MSCRAMM family adhesin SdrC [Aeoliella sp. ICT_H6.2]|uniref:MSCRAMM family adhesin SdrC n=1 Tax=Aeoliella straminimaris TaxID=2954799 RepID=A0A9X2FH16_9BACT|nr:MSCRAMM family adhesin SdrC [Aeoliella straminimaris]MCO6048142.1 MSCRAMM family adhesin SdrC [Aeoliella straminimaris]
MRKSLTTFAGTLAAAGLLTISSVSIGQNTPESETPQPPAAAEQSEQTAEETAEKAENNGDVAKDKAAEDSASASNEAESAADSAEESVSNQQESNDKQQQDAVENSQERSDNESNNNWDSEKDKDTDEQASDAERKSDSDAQDKLNAPPVPEQARDANANSNAPRDANWRMVGYQNQWWYYSPQGQWMIHRGDQWRPYNSANARQLRYEDGARMTANRQSPQRYSTGYRGVEESQSMDSQPATTRQSATPVRYDRCGRAFICQNGQRIYVQMQNETQPTTANKSVVSENANNAQPTLADERVESRSYDVDGDADDIGRPTPARDELRSVPPAPPKAE